MRTLSGVLLRKGRSRHCWRTLHTFCAAPRAVPVVPQGENPTRPTPVTRGVKLRPRAPAPLPGARVRLPAVAPRTGAGRPPRLPTSPHLDVWDQLQAQPHMAYGLKYCRLSRRVRKILRNRYRYSKYFFMVPPAKRLVITLHLWKYVLKFYDEPTFAERLRALGDNFEPGAPRDEGLL